MKRALRFPTGWAQNWRLIVLLKFLAKGQSPFRYSAGATGSLFLFTRAPWVIRVPVTLTVLLVIPFLMRLVRPFPVSGLFRASVLLLLSVILIPLPFLFIILIFRGYGMPLLSFIPGLGLTRFLTVIWFLRLISGLTRLPFVFLFLTALSIPGLLVGPGQVLFQARVIILFLLPNRTPVQDGSPLIVVKTVAVADRLKSVTSFTKKRRTKNSRT